jgi:hypothetical protein
LEKVDAVVFGHDKFAFEMVHFLKASLGKKSDRPSSGNKTISNKSIEDLWETNFVQGLETLLVECAVVNDDIERDCFVSRVYCWFTEKLQERRDLPRKSKHDPYAPVLVVLYSSFQIVRCKSGEPARFYRAARWRSNSHVTWSGRIREKPRTDVTAG